MELLGPCLFIAIGAFAVAGAVMDWDFFMDNPRARIFYKLLGRNGARGFYFLLGVAVAGVGLAGLLGIIPIPAGDGAR